MTELHVDLSAPTPVYEQIRTQVAGLVAVGALAPGARLPASRDLARDLGIAVGTVQRAYRELEADGLVVSRRRTGTVVAGESIDASTGSVTGYRVGAGPLRPDPADALLDEVRALVRHGRAAGLTDGELLTLVRGAQSEAQR